MAKHVEPLRWTAMSTRPASLEEPLIHGPAELYRGSAAEFSGSRDLCAARPRNRIASEQHLYTMPP